MTHRRWRLLSLQSSWQSRWQSVFTWAAGPPIPLVTSLPTDKSPWFVNGVAFAGDYLSAASFLGICGMIATYGYDGFLYSIGFLAGWIVALFVIAEPMKRLGRFTFADALDAKFNSRGIRFAAGLSTLVVSVFYLIPQMVGAGVLVRPLLGLPHWAGVIGVGVIVIVIVVTAGMVSTTWVQFLKGSLLVLFTAVVVVAILQQGFTVDPATAGTIRPAGPITTFDGKPVVAAEDGWQDHPQYFRVQSESGIDVYRTDLRADGNQDVRPVQTVRSDSTEKTLHSVGHIVRLPDGRSESGPLGPLSFFQTLSTANWRSDAARKSLMTMGNRQRSTMTNWCRAMKFCVREHTPNSREFVATTRLPNLISSP